MDNQKDSAGYLPLNRGFFEHKFWTIKREFSKAEAWIDLLQLVSYDEKEKTIWINDKPINYGRGQYPASLRFLLDRWNWKSKTKVENFLKYLKNEDMIKIETRTGQNVITVCKYETYNPIKKKKGQREDTEKDSERTLEGQCEDNTNKGNKDNKDLYEFFLHEINTLTKRKFKGEDKSRKQLAARLKEGYTFADLKTAIENCMKDEFHKANPNYLTPEFITRQDKLEKYLNAKPANNVIPISAPPRTRYEVDCLFGTPKVKSA